MKRSSEGNEEIQGSGEHWEAARELAELTGTSVAGETPSERGIDLNTELMVRNNMAIASLTVLAALVGEDQSNRSIVLEQMDSDFFAEKTLEAYLFEWLVQTLKRKGEVSRQDVLKAVNDYGPTVWGEPTDSGATFKINQIYKLDPSMKQVRRAIELREIWAKDQD